MTEPTYGGLTITQLWQAIAEAGCAEMSIKPLVLAALLRAAESQNVQPVTDNSERVAELRRLYHENRGWSER